MTATRACENGAPPPVPTRMEYAPLLYVIAGLLVVVGLAGTILPALPGLPLVFGGLLLAAWAGGFDQVGLPMIGLLALLTLLSLVIDFWATALGARRVGASRKAIIGAMLGTLGGLFLGPIGLLAGPFAGALAGELLHRRSVLHSDVGHAARIGFGTWMGILFGTVLKLALAFTMLGLFALAWWL